MAARKRVANTATGTRRWRKFLTSENTDIAAFGIKGGETNKQIQEWVDDYDSEVRSEKAESRYSSHNHDLREEQDAFDRELYG